MDRYALITGSASGLAVAFARKLASAGYSLALNYRSSRASCEHLAQTLQDEFGVEAFAIQADMTNPEEIDLMMDTVLGRFGKLEALVHSAGPFLFARKRLADYTNDEWNEMIAGNLSSAFYLFRRVIPVMRPEGYGRIVTVGFERVEDAPGWVYRSAYAAAKTGLASLTRTVAQEEWENGITANMICPGDIRGKYKEAKARGPANQSPLRKPSGGDLAELVAFLLSREAQYISGNILNSSGFVDVLAGFDRGKSEVYDAKDWPEGTLIYVIPEQQTGIIKRRVDRRNRRSIYTVETQAGLSEWTADQLEEADFRGV